MKFCKQCQAENPDTSYICESCGAELEPVTAEPEEITAEQPAAKKKTRWIPITIIVVLSIALAVSVFFAVKNLIERFDAKQEPSVSAPTEPEAPADAPEETPEETPEKAPVEIISAGHHINAYGLPSHSIYFAKAEDGTVTYSYLNEAGETVAVTEEELDALMAQEVAFCAGVVLDNRQLMYYYDDQVYNFQNNYSQYLGFLMNTEQALDEQISTDGGNTWEQSFINGAVAMFRQMTAIEAEARAAGYTMTAEEQANVDASAEELQEIAESHGYDSSDAYLQAYYGPYASAESYVKYYEQNVYVNSYLANLEANMPYTDEELDTFYAENEAMLNSYGIFNTDKNVINIRHILIQPAASYNDDGTSTISDEAWADAEAKAQQIYDEWKSGEATEETFAALAGEHTQDPGSMTTGGLYEEVFPGQMVAEFNDWCFADGRAVGDHGIVKTSYGFHIMYFSGEGDFIYWRQEAADFVKMHKVDQLILETAESYALTADLDKAVLLNSTAPTVPEAEEEAE